MLLIDISKEINPCKKPHYLPEYCGAVCVVSRLDSPLLSISSIFTGLRFDCSYQPQWADIVPRVWIVYIEHL